jgi:hypothetical protein
VYNLACLKRCRDDDIGLNRRETAGLIGLAGFIGRHLVASDAVSDGPRITEGRVLDAGRRAGRRESGVEG